MQKYLAGKDESRESTLLLVIVHESIVEHIKCEIEGLKHSNELKTWLKKGSEDIRCK